MTNPQPSDAPTDELSRLRDKVARIMEGLEGCCMTCEPIGVRNRQMEREIATLKSERDEARREVCEYAVGLRRVGMRVQHPPEYAKERAWNCYEEDGLQ